MADKGWHIKKKFIPKTKITYIPIEPTPYKLLKIEMPEGYHLEVEEPGEKHHRFSGPCRLELNPSLFVENGKISIDLEKDSPLESSHG